MAMFLWVGCTPALLRPGAEAAQSPLAAGDVSEALAPWLPTDLLLLGEQHDAPAHQQQERAVVQALAQRGVLAAVVLEMADTGHSTQALGAQASAAQVREALHWNDAAWPWAAYGPVVMAAVQAGVPVWGGNLARAALPAVMGDAHWDGLLPGPALKAQQQAVRLGHCGLLPESHIRPMTRAQIARDAQLAAQATRLLQPGRTVLLIAGNGHVDKALGIPQHLALGVKVTAIALQAGSEASGTQADATWPTAAAPASDPCAGLRESLSRPSAVLKLAP